MSKPTWIDQTLNEAVRLQYTGGQLDELAGMLSALGIEQAALCLNDWHRYYPDLSHLQKKLDLCGVMNLASCELALAEQAGVRQVRVVYCVSSQAEFNVKLNTVMSEADRRGLQISLRLEGLASLSGSELAAIVSVISGYPLSSVIYGDQAGSGNPFTTFEQINALKKSLNCLIGIQAGNAYGLATANTLAAMKAGVTQIATSIAGVGALAPWEEALMAAKQLAGIAVEIPMNLADGCRQVLAAMNMSVPQTKAIIGSAIFAHESGLHVDGVNKDPGLYEPFAPELVGLSRQFIIGKHSGTAALRTKFAAWGIRLEENESKALLTNVRALAVRKKAAITDDELQRLYLSG
jgi:homocitrate synthase NifV